jgi:hypothetical protein
MMRSPSVFARAAPRRCDGFRKRASRRSPLDPTPGSRVPSEAVGASARAASERRSGRKDLERPISRRGAPAAIRGRRANRRGAEGRGRLAPPPRPPGGTPDSPRISSRLRAPVEKAIVELLREDERPRGRARDKRILRAVRRRLRAPSLPRGKAANPPSLNDSARRSVPPRVRRSDRAFREVSTSRPPGEIEIAAGGARPHPSRWIDGRPGRRTSRITRSATRFRARHPEGLAAEVPLAYREIEGERLGGGAEERGALAVRSSAREEDPRDCGAGRRVRYVSLSAARDARAPQEGVRASDGEGDPQPRGPRAWTEETGGECSCRGSPGRVRRSLTVNVAEGSPRDGHQRGARARRGIVSGRAADQIVVG